MLANDKYFTPSNLLTCLRIVLTPLIVLAIQREYWVIAFVCFIVAGVTDLLDGYLARLFNMQSKLGALLDPIADKFFLLSSFSALVFFKNPFLLIPFWFFILIFIREFILLLGGTIFFLMKIPFEIKPTYSGKIATCLQMVLVGMLFLSYFIPLMPIMWFKVAIFLITIMVLGSLFQYVNIGLRLLIASIK